MMVDWRQTRLWKALEGMESAEATRLTVQINMPKVEETLRAGTPASPSFTLHDNEHSFRVAERMVDLLGGSVGKLSDIETALLLMSAYCHDIGMSPDRGRVRDHATYLITGDENILSQTDQINLQTWLDVNWEGATAPISSTAISASGLLEVEEITAYYARSRHNDWSEEWIRANLNPSEHPLYHRWVEDLITLCKSHHDGITQLRSQRFNSKQVGSPPRPLNLRYLACLLRLADVLEFAPERTPEVILKQRAVNPSSRIFWHKDHSISFALDHSNGVPNLSARTSTSAIHHAVLQTAQWVDDELAVCSTLEQEGAFTSGNLIGEQRSAYTWPWSGKLHRDIKEADDTFVYIDGAFRPDSLRVLELLSGTALYSKPIVALRELIQNSLDAIKEQIAYERLQQSNPLDQKLIDHLSHIHKIRIELSKEQDRYWLRCIDDGTGMTRSQIEKSLLVSGSNIRGDLRQLDRKAKSTGFIIGRTGKFGVGVLSYFMLADKLTLYTRRSQESNDTDGCGWAFDIDGIGSFGELTKHGRAARGTEIALRLKEDIVGDNAELWFSSALKYLSDQIIHAPCVIEFRNNLSGSPAVSIGPNWTHEEKSKDLLLIDSMFGKRTDHNVLRTKHEEEIEERAALELKRLRNRAANTLNWFGEGEVKSTDPSALIKIRLPYWRIDGAVCSAFFNMNDKRQIAALYPIKAYYAQPQYVQAWQGIKVDENNRMKYGAAVHINFLSDREVSVDRFRFVDRNLPVREIIRTEIRDVWEKFLADNSTSIFNEFNVAVSPLPSKRKALYLREVPCWPVVTAGQSATWNAVQNGIVSLVRLSFYNSDKYAFKLNDEFIEEAVEISHNRSIKLHDLYAGGQIIGHDIDNLSGGMIGLRWNSIDDMIRYDGTLRNSGSKFPLVWKDIFVALNPGRSIFNEDHPLFVKFVQIGALPVVDNDMTLEEKLLLSNKDLPNAARFIMSNLTQKPAFWLALVEKHTAECRTMLNMLEVTGSNQLCVLAARELYDNEGITDIGGIVFDNDTSARRRPAVSLPTELRLVDVNVQDGVNEGV